MRAAIALFAASLTSSALAAYAQSPQTPITYAQAIASAHDAAPELTIAASRERIATGEIDVAGIYPNPSVNVGTSTQAARFSAGVSIPLVILGQRGAAIDASRADLATVKVETQVAWNDVRTATAKAFIDLWLAQERAAARNDGAAVARRIETAVRYLVEAGKSPETDSLRVHAERLRADADALESAGLVDVAATELGRWVGASNDRVLRASGAPVAPEAPPPFETLAARIDASPSVRRERADAASADARVHRERVAVRPTLALDLGVDAFDYTLLTPGETGRPPNNYRAILSLDVPLFNQRGALIHREQIAADAARTRASVETIRQLAALRAAYTTLLAISARAKALGQGVVPAAEEAAKRTEEAHVLGYAPLFAVLDAEKARIDAKVQYLEARAAQAAAWEDVLHAVGGAT